MPLFDLFFPCPCWYVQCACIFTAFSVPQYEHMKICIVSLLVDIWILFSIFAITNIPAVYIVVSRLVHTYKGFSRAQTLKWSS